MSFLIVTCSHFLEMLFLVCIPPSLPCTACFGSGCMKGSWAAQFRDKIEIAGGQGGLELEPQRLPETAGLCLGVVR